MKKFLIVIGILLLVILGIVIGGYAYFDSVLNGPQGEGAEQTFLIVEGEGARDVADRLEGAGIIKHSTIFQIHLWKEGIVSQIKTGEFTLSPASSMVEIANTITGNAAKDNDEIVVTIIEGLRRDEVADVLEENGVLDADTFMELTADAAAWDYDFLQDLPSDATLEGYLFPDTYNFSPDNTPTEVISKMLDNFAKKTQSLRTDSGEAFSDTVILASIIEQEVHGQEDRERVSGILQNRLAIDMKLQVDATLSFILQDAKSRHSIAETQIDDPYNTYVYAGLPPGPISNPSLSALEAAANPESNDFFFFLTTEDGQVIYSETAEEHAAAKAEFLN